MKRVAAIMIGRGGSSFKDKNIRLVLGHPLLHYAAAAARRSRYIHDFYISSDSEKILEVGRVAGYKPILRPAHLATAIAQSPDVIRHAYDRIPEELKPDIVLVQHANVGTITTEVIDTCIEMIIQDDTLSAVVPSHEKAEYHPYRAKRVDNQGFLQPFVELGEHKVSANRQDLPQALFFDHSIWVLRVKSSLLSAGGQSPWTCMGNRIKAVKTSGCFDVHDEGDLLATEDWLRANHVPAPAFQASKEIGKEN